MGAVPVVELREPEDVRTRETTTFVSRHLPVSPARVLDVGCGKGRLAQALQALGHAVTGIDLDAEAIEAAQARGVEAQQTSLLDYQGGPFDAVVFSYSLHHVQPLDAAMEALAGLLAPKGRVIVEEMAFDRVDGATAAWSLGMQDVLLAAGVLGETAHLEYSDELTGADPLARWLDARDRRLRAHGHTHGHGHSHGHSHAHEHGHGTDDVEHLHESRAMRDHLATRFRLLHEEDGPGLWAFWLDGLDTSGTETAKRLLALERSLIEQGAIRPFSVRWVLGQR